MHFQRYLVSPAELQIALENQSKSSRSVVPLSAAWFLPNDAEKRTGIESFKQRHIAGSRFFDLDKISDTTSDLPHMLPNSTIFAEAMGKLGIRTDDTVVVYDTAELGIFSAPRVAWTLKVFGHPEVHLLNNFRVWVEEGRPIASGDPHGFEHTEYQVNPGETREETHLLARHQQVTQDVKEKRDGKHGKYKILDARPGGRWHGKDPEPRPGLPSGHMPGSISVPFTDVLDPKTKAFLPPEQLKQIFAKKGVGASDPIISSCGTGVTAVVLDAALSETGWQNPERRVYDESWTGWATTFKDEPAKGMIQVSS